MRTIRAIALGVGVVATLGIGLVVDRTSHSVSDTLIGAAVPVLLVWLAIAAFLAVLRRRFDGRVRRS